MALYYSNINVFIREISLRERPKALYSISAKGTVPVLELPDGSVIDESLEIMLWALNLSDQDNWLFFDENIQKNVISINDNNFKKLLDEYKYKATNQNKDILFDACSKYLDTYEKSLEKYTNILSENISLVDIAILPFIRQFSLVDDVKFNTTFPNLKRWLKLHLSSNLFESVMKKYKLWDGKSIVTEKLIN